MLKNEKLKNVKIAFIFSATVKESSWDIWERFIKEGENKEWYYWEIERETRKAQKGNDKLSSVLEDFIIVEDFFLSKQLFHVGRDYTMISRFIPPINIELHLPIESKDSNKMKVKPNVIVSFYREVGVVTMILNIAFDEIGIDDLIYIKSLKWNSIRHYKEAPKIDVNINTNNEQKEEQYFCDIFEVVFNEIYKGKENKLKISTANESILDLIEIRDDGKIVEGIFNEKRYDLLYGILVGDEGYMINNSKMMEEHIRNPAKCISTRKYFKYFFETTTILGVFSRNYPENKEKFSKVYAKQYNNFEPLCKYISLTSGIANLNDGQALVGEITMVRSVILKEIDLNIRKKFEEEKMKLKDLLSLKREIITKITDIELLAKDVLWINLLSSTDEMLGYNTIKRNVQERLVYIDSDIRDKYNAKVNHILIVLAAIAAIIGLITIAFHLLNHVQPPFLCQ